MEINVEVISREIIKPTTSPHDRYNFCIMDQFSPSWYMPFLYFYSVDRKLICKNEISKNLKTSLSQVLNHYYLLAGIVNDTFIDCKNGGVPVLEAQVNCHLSEILQNPNPEKFVNQFLPEDVNNFVLTVQLNFFNCGGFAVGVRMSHKIADASSVITFINYWAETARNGYIDNVRPKIVGTTLFLSKDNAVDHSSRYPVEKNVMSKRFVFTNSNINSIKEKYIITPSTESSKTYISRFKILSSFLWNRFAASTELNKGPKKSCLLTTAMNLRKMVDPPLLDDSFGNAAGVAVSVVYSEDDIEEEGYNYRIVNKLTAAMSKFKKDFVKKLQDGKLDSLSILDGADENTLKREMVGFACTSFIRLPIYEADFGWGKPIWCAIGVAAVKNLHVFLDTKNGDGIEAWINMRAEDMAKFESDKELLAYACPTSCP